MPQARSTVRPSVAITRVVAAWLGVALPAAALAQHAGDTHAADTVAVDAVEADSLKHPPAVYLTWVGDPTTSVVIHWHTRTNETRAETRPEGAGDEGDESQGDRSPQLPEVMLRRAAADQPWRAAQPNERAANALPGTDRLVHAVSLTGLEPDTVYQFRFGDEDDARVYRFRTMPESVRPGRGGRAIRFAVTGDAYRDARYFAAMAMRVAERDVDFVVLGGDIVGDEGKPARAERWTLMLDVWQDLFVSPDGRLIPIVPVIGNHETNHGGFGRPARDALGFHTVFAWPGTRGYGVLDFGEDVSLLTLNTGHTAAVDGEQAGWLESALRERAERTHTFAAYHVNMFPAERGYHLASHARVRHAWSPIFDRHRLDAAFEHHEHSYKRTQPIRGERVDAYGTVYLGNGGFSERESRVPDPPGSWTVGGRWYLAASSSTNHAIVVTVEGDRRAYEAVDVAGEVFDRYAQVDGTPSRVSAVSGYTAWPAMLWTGGVAAVLGAVVGAVSARKTAAGVLRRRMRHRLEPRNPRQNAAVQGVRDEVLEKAESI